MHKERESYLDGIFPSREGVGTLFPLSRCQVTSVRHLHVPDEKHLKAQVQGPWTTQVISSLWQHFLYLQNIYHPAFTLKMLVLYELYEIHRCFCVYMYERERERERCLL